MKAALVVLADLFLVGGVVATLGRWLRVAQREHYLPGSVTPFLGRWMRARWANTASTVVAVAALASSTVLPVSFKAAAAIAVVGAIGFVCPLGLSIKGRTAPFVWTERARRLGGTVATLAAVVVGLASLLGSATVGLGLVLLACPLLVDAALWLLGPSEDRRMQRYVDQASTQLRDVAPTVVAITGSFGKTSTKQHLAQLLHGRRTTVATPASFNNRGGLARAINEHLHLGTEVFLAEMGTYGPGEIAALCSWIPPKVSVLTAIGPVHLERFGSLEVTTAAKAEIAVGAEVVVVNGDDPRLAALADQLAAGGQRVLRCSGIDRSADVALVEAGGMHQLLVAGKVVGAPVHLDQSVRATNVACAIAAATALGIDAADLVATLGTLGAAANRLTVAVAPSGVTVLDDTFNSNPTGAAAALEVLGQLEVARRYVVTPGMVELGAEAASANRAFGEAAGRLADTVVVVGRTNRRSLHRGLTGTKATVVDVATREDAVAYIRTAATARDAVLYENDLPDHYP